jgi:hypothetical protein
MPFYLYAKAMKYRYDGVTACTTVLFSQACITCVGLYCITVWDYQIAGEMPLQSTVTKVLNTCPLFFIFWLVFRFYVIRYCEENAQTGTFLHQ